MSEFEHIITIEEMAKKQGFPVFSDIYSITYYIKYKIPYKFVIR